MIAIIDYGVGNLFSLTSSFKAIGEDVIITNDIKTIKSAIPIDEIPSALCPKSVANTAQEHIIEALIEDAEKPHTPE